MENGEDIKTQDNAPSQEAPPAEAQQSANQDILTFPEGQIKGQAFSQHDPKTGWLWVGVHLPSFGFRTAFSIFRSQEMKLSLEYDKLEQERMRRMQIAAAAGGGKNGGLLQRFLPNLRKH